MNKQPYVYKALVTDVYDGDTITVTWDLGFGITQRKQKIRLFGIDTPEMRGPEKVEGKKVRDFVREMILNKTVTIESIRDKKGKYGRYLGIVWADADGVPVNLNDLLVHKHYARVAKY